MKKITLSMEAGLLD